MERISRKPRYINTGGKHTEFKSGSFRYSALGNHLACYPEDGQWTPSYAAANEEQARAYGHKLLKGRTVFLRNSSGTTAVVLTAGSNELGDPVNGLPVHNVFQPTSYVQGVVVKGHPVGQSLAGKIPPPLLNTTPCHPMSRCDLQAYAPHMKTLH